MLLRCILIAVVPLLQQHLPVSAWRTDLAFFQSLVEHRHPAPFHQVSRSKFELAVASLNRRLPGLNNADIVMSFQRLLAMIGDGHTTLPLFYSDNDPQWRAIGFHQYAIRIEHFSDGWFVSAGAADYRDLVGGRVLSIGGVPLAAVLAKAEPYVSRDNAYTPIARLPYFLTSPEMLEGASIVSSARRAIVTVDNGGRVLAMAMRDRRPGEQLTVAMRSPSAPVPLREQNVDKPFWMAPVTNGVLYVGYNAVRNGPDETFEHFCGRLLDVIRRQHPQKVVVDMRRNEGGDGSLNLYLLNTIARAPEIDTSTSLFVLIGPATFFAAQLAVDDFDLRTNATFLGEPTGARPDHYGDGRGIPLPNSGLEVDVSTVYHQEEGPYDFRAFTPPQVAVDVSSSDERNGIDPAMDALDTYVPFSTYASDAIKDLNVDAFLAKYASYRANPANEFNTLLTTSATFGQELLAARRPSDAARVVGLALRDYAPTTLFSGDKAYHALASAYEALHDAADTEATCKLWLTFDPYNPEALSELRTLHDTTVP